MKRTGLIAAVIVLVIVGLLAWQFLPGGATANAEKITPEGYQTDFVDTPHLLLDVRTPGEYASGFIEGAENIPLQELASRLSEIPADTPVVVYCQSGNRSSTATRLLSEAGYTVYDLGGVQQWQAAGFTLTQ